MSPSTKRALTVSAIFIGASLTIAILEYLR